MKTLTKAIKEARRFAAGGPRVSAILRGKDKEYGAVAGYVDSNDALPKGMTQDFLVTPDGRVWSPVDAEKVARTNHSWKLIVEDLCQTRNRLSN